MVTARSQGEYADKRKGCIAVFESSNNTCFASPWISNPKCHKTRVDSKIKEDPVRRPTKQYNESIKSKQNNTTPAPPSIKTESMKLACQVHAYAFVAVFITNLRQGCEANNFIPLTIGEHFSAPFGETDLFRGYKLTRHEDESPFKDKVFVGTYKDRPFTTEYVYSNTLGSTESFEDFIGIEGSFSATFGPASGAGSGEFYDLYTKSRNEISLVYTRRSAAYAKSVELETLQGSQKLVDVCGGPCGPQHTGPIADALGTHFIDQIVYGAQIDFTYTITSREDVDIMNIEAELNGELDLKSLYVSFEAFFSMKNENSNSKYQVSISCKASGVNFAVPSNPDIDQVPEILEQFNEVYGEIIDSLGDYETVNEEANVLRTVSPIGFTVASISDNLPAMDAMKVNVLTMKLKELARTLNDSFVKRSKLRKVLRRVRTKYADADPKFRDEFFLPYRVEVAKLVGELDDIIQACLNYRKKPLEEILVEAPPKGFGEGTAEENEINEAIFHALQGKAYVAPPVRFGDDTPIDLGIYYTGFALPYNDSESGFYLAPHFSGAVYNDTNEEFIADGATTAEVYDNYVATLPVILPPHQIGYKTPFVIQVKDMYASIREDPESEETYAKTQFYKGFCKETRSSTELQFLAKPEDIYDGDEIEKDHEECLRYGDIVYIAFADADEAGDVFLKPESGAKSANMTFGNPMTDQGGKYRFQVQSAIPFTGQFNSPVPDPKFGECVDRTGGYNLFLQSELGKRWVTGANMEMRKEMDYVVDKVMAWARYYDYRYGRTNDTTEVEMPKDDYDDMYLQNIFEDATGIRSLAYDYEQYKWKITSFDTSWTDNGCDAKRTPPKEKRKKRRRRFALKDLRASFKAGDGLEFGRSAGYLGGTLKGGDFLALRTKRKNPFGSSALNLPGSSASNSKTAAQKKATSAKIFAIAQYTESSKSGLFCKEEKGLQSALVGIACRQGKSCSELSEICANDGKLKLLIGQGQPSGVFGVGKFQGKPIPVKMDCPDAFVVTGVKCVNGNCNKLQLQCHKLLEMKLDKSDCQTESLVSGTRNVPTGYYATGVSCARNCVSKVVRFCRDASVAKRVTAAAKSSASRIKSSDESSEKPADLELKKSNTRAGLYGPGDY